MSKKKVSTYCLVIDASIARAAGPLESEHPTGAMCREFLMSVRSVCHRMAWSAPIKAEWDKHVRGRAFAGQWLTSMMKLKKLRMVEAGEVADLREAVSAHCPDEKVAAIVLKDCHLIEAAFATDSRIASLDEMVRSHLAQLSHQIESLQNVVWVNPTKPDEQAVLWLETGAPARNKRCLKCKLG